MQRCIVSIKGSELDWSTLPPPLEDLDEDIIYTVLHYLYGECLPPGLSVETAEKCVSLSTTYSSLQTLSTMCQLYLKNITLKNSKFLNLLSNS